MNNAIIILNYNDYATTEKLIEKIKGYDKIDKIIIVDNASTDNSYQQLENKYKVNKKIDILESDKNLGYSGGNNLGIKYAIEKYNIDYFFVANPDIMFEENIIDEIENVLKENDDIGIVAPKVSNGYNSWRLPTYSKTITSMFLFLNKKFGNEVYKTQTQAINYVDVVAGSLFVMKTDVYKEIDGFDDETFLYYEENIIGYKLKNINKKSAILGNIYYDHNHATSIKKVYKSKIKPFLISVKSIKIYNKKYLKIGKIKRLIFNIAFIFAYVERFFYDIFIKIGYFLKRKKG